MSGIDMNEQFQIELLSKFHAAFGSEYDLFPASSGDPLQFHFSQATFPPVDAEILVLHDSTF